MCKNLLIYLANELAGIDMLSVEMHELSQGKPKLYAHYSKFTNFSGIMEGD